MTFQQQYKAIANNPTKRAEAFAKVAAQHVNKIDTSHLYEALRGVKK